MPGFCSLGLEDRFDWLWPLGNLFDKVLLSQINLSMQIFNKNMAAQSPSLYLASAAHGLFLQQLYALFSIGYRSFTKDAIAKAYKNMSRTTIQRRTTVTTTKKLQLARVESAHVWKQTSCLCKVVVSEASSTKCIFYKNCSIKTTDSDYPSDISGLTRTTWPRSWKLLGSLKKKLAQLLQVKTGSPNTSFCRQFCPCWDCVISVWKIAWNGFDHWEISLILFAWLYACTTLKSILAYS